MTTWLILGALLLQQNASVEVVVQSGHADTINALDFSADGRLLSTAADDGSARVWNISSGREVLVIREPHGSTKVTAARFVEGSVMTSGDDGALRFWDPTTGTLLNSMELENERMWNSCAVPADASAFAIGRRSGYDSVLTLLDTQGATTAEIKFGTEGARGMSFSPDGKNIAASDLMRVALYSSSGNLLWEEETETGNCAHSLTFTPDGKVLVSGDWGGFVRLRDAKDGKLLREFRHARRQWVWDVALDSEGEQVASAGGDGTVKLWNLKTGALLHTFSDTERPLEETDPPAYFSVAISPDGRLLAAGTGVHDASGEVHVWSLDSHEMIRRLRGAQGLNELDVSQDGRWLLVGGEDQTARLWDLSIAQQVRTFSGHGRAVRGVAIDPTGPRVVTTTEGAGSHIWNLLTGESLARLNDVGSSVGTVCFSPDGSSIATADSAVHLWNVKDGSKQRSLAEGSFPFGVDFINDRLVHVVGYRENSRGGVYVVSSGSKVEAGPFSEMAEALGRVVGPNAFVSSGKLWDAESMTPVAPLSMQAHSMKLSPDGSLLVGVDRGSHVAILWDVKKDAERARLVGHSNGVMDIAFSPNGERVYTSSRDGTVGVWDTKDGSRVATLMSLGPDWAAFLPGGHYTVGRNAIDSIFFRRGEEELSYESFDVAFNRPDKVLAALGTGSSEMVNAYKAAAHKRFEKLGLSETASNIQLPLPELLITSQTPFETEEKSITIECKAHDKESELSQLQLRVNDIPVFGVKGLPVEGHEIERSIEVELGYGSNRIQLYVQNASGLESPRQTVIINRGGPREKPELRIVVVGVSDYPGADFDLEYAAKDARDVGAAMKESNLFRSVHVHELLDSDATREALLATREFLAETDVNDHVVIFLAGHGVLDEKDGYVFATHDADLTASARGGLPFDEIEALVDGIPARRRLLLLDTCHAGEFDEEAIPQDESAEGTVRARGIRGLTVKRNETRSAGPSAFGLMRTLFADLRKSTGAVIIASSGGAEFAFESPEWNNGVFTYALLNGLSSRSADLNYDGFIRVSELRDHVTQQVVALTGGQQTPMARKENLTLDYVVH